MTYPDDPTWIVCEGEKVRVCSDETVAIKLQDDVVGWHDDLRNVNKTFYSPLFTAAPANIRMFSNVHYNNGVGTVTRYLI